LGAFQGILVSLQSIFSHLKAFGVTYMSHFWGPFQGIFESLQSIFSHLKAFGVT
jgi:hypothetical protein